MRQFRKATIKDVAKQAGVSTTTVSYFVSGRDSVCSPETALRIKEAIEQLHYTPSSLTGGLRRRATATIGVCTFHPLDPEVKYGAAYFERLVRGIMREADVVKYELLRYHEALRNSMRSDVFLDGRVDGLIFDPVHDRHAPRMVRAGMPTVVVGRSRTLAEGAGCIHVNEAMTADLALSYLWALGHRRIAHIAGPITSGSVEVAERDDVAMGRLESYIAWMEKRSAYDPSLVGYTQSWGELTDKEIVAVWRHRKDPPTAVFCVNDAAAIGLITEAAAMGWRTPQDLSVVGVDNFGDSVKCVPALTTIDAPVEGMGREAVRAIVNLINGVPVEQCRISVPVTELVVRDSAIALAR